MRWGRGGWGRVTKANAALWTGAKRQKWKNLSHNWYTVTHTNTTSHHTTLKHFKFQPNYSITWYNLLQHSCQCRKYDRMKTTKTLTIKKWQRPRQMRHVCHKTCVALLCSFTTLRIKPVRIWTNLFPHEQLWRHRLFVEFPNKCWPSLSELTN